MVLTDVSVQPGIMGTRLNGTVVGTRVNGTVVGTHVKRNRCGDQSAYEDCR